MLNQLSPQEVVLNVQQIAESSSKMLQTDIPTSELDTFMDLALKARKAKISTVSLVPPKVNTSDPDFDKIRTMVDDGIARSEGEADESGGQDGQHENGANQQQNGHGEEGQDQQKAANATADLGSVC